MTTEGNPLSALHRRLGGVVHEFTKFGVVGLANAALFFVVFNALIAADVDPVAANVVAMIVGTTSSYFMNRHWSFRHRARSGLRREYSVFLLINIVGLGISTATVAAARYAVDLTGPLALNTAGALGLLLGTGFRFWSYRRWVFLPADPAMYAHASATDSAEARTRQ